MPNCEVTALIRGLRIPRGHVGLAASTRAEAKAFEELAERVAVFFAAEQALSGCR